MHKPAKHTNTHFLYPYTHSLTVTVVDNKCCYHLSARDKLPAAKRDMETK